MTRPKGEPTSIFIGLAEVRQLPGAGQLMDRNAAFVNVVAPAIDAEDFRSHVSRSLRDLGFELLEIEDVNALEPSESQLLDADLAALAERAAATGEVQFGTFHTWIIDE